MPYYSRSKTIQLISALDLTLQVESAITPEIQIPKHTIGSTQPPPGCVHTKSIQIPKAKSPKQSKAQFKYLNHTGLTPTSTQLNQSLNHLPQISKTRTGYQISNQCYGTHLRGQVITDIASNYPVPGLGVVFVVSGRRVYIGNQGSRASPLTLSMSVRHRASEE